MVLCADARVQHSAKHRPKMSQVQSDWKHGFWKKNRNFVNSSETWESFQIVRAFDKSISLDDLIQGVALGDITSYSLDESSGYSSTKYKEDVKKFKRLVLESQTFGSSGLTSDNGQSSPGSFCIKSEDWNVGDPNKKNTYTFLSRPHEWKLTNSVLYAYFYSDGVENALTRCSHLLYREFINIFLARPFRLKNLQ